MNWLKQEEWSPYVGGIVIGLVSWFAFLTVKPLGASTTFVRTAGMIEKLFAPERVKSLPYFIKEVPKIDWQWMLVVGIMIGSFVAAKLSGRFRWQFVPPMWEKRFGPNRVRRWIVAFVGGIIAIVGARMAGGCPTGHGLSGGMQLAVSGWLFLVFFFAGGILTAKILYRGR
jgi:uncharacterized membrane protein YedE/YeeE